MQFKLPRKKKKDFKKRGHMWKYYLSSKCNWEAVMFPRRIDVRCMEIILTYPKLNMGTVEWEFDPNIANPATNEQLLSWYKEHYPNDKLAQHYCIQNRHKWDKFNRI